LTSPATRGWFHACRHAVEACDLQTLQAWLNKESEPQKTFMRFSSSKKAAGMINAHLLCAHAIVAHEDWPTRTVPVETLHPIAAETGLALGFLRDLTQELFTGELRPATQEVSLTLLLVEKIGQEEKGIPVSLNLELLPEGTGALYPLPALAFVNRDHVLHAEEESFRQAEENACAYVQNTARLWQRNQDVRWRLERWDEKPLPRTLIGNSAGAAFALGLAKLFGKA
jgi:hypothetical protein